eukprot:COSAG01_NODE_12361_length_1752_cov_8.804598_2_plen_256_part_01
MVPIIVKDSSPSSYWDLTTFFCKAPAMLRDLSHFLVDPEKVSLATGLADAHWKQPTSLADETPKSEPPFDVDLTWNARQLLHVRTLPPQALRELRQQGGSKYDEWLKTVETPQGGNLTVADIQRVLSSQLLSKKAYEYFPNHHNGVKVSKQELKSIINFIEKALVSGNDQEHDKEDTSTGAPYAAGGFPSEDDGDNDEGSSPLRSVQQQQAAINQKLRAELAKLQKQLRASGCSVHDADGDPVAIAQHGVGRMVQS